ELRGVPGEWHVYAVEETSTDRALPVDPPSEPVAGRRDRRVLIAVGGAAALVVVVVGTVALASLPMSEPVVPRPNTVVEIRAADGQLASVVEIEDPTETALDQQVLWVLSGSGRTLNRVALPGRSISAVGLPATPTGMALGDGSVWITTGFGALSGEAGVLSVGMSSRQVEGTIPLGNGADGVAVGAGAVWVTNRIDNTLTRIDLTTRTISGMLQVGEEPGAVAVGEGSVWVAHGVDGTVWRIDPGTLTRTAEVTLADQPYDITVAFGSLWVTSQLGASVTMVDVSSNTIQRTLVMPGAARGITSSPSEVWVAIGNGEVARIDPADPQGFGRIAVDGAPHDVAADASGAWVSLRE
ncbi:MAG: Vgb family protein, partial [Aeromicrobium sp.]